MNSALILQTINRLFASQYHLPLNVFLQEVGRFLGLEKAAVYYNRLDFRWQLVASRVCVWESEASASRLPDIIEYQEVWPALETRLSTGQWVILGRSEIESLGFFNEIDHYIYVFPLLESKWWNGIFLLDFGVRAPGKEELALAKALAESLSIAIKRQKKESEFLDTTRVFQELLNNIPDIVILTDAHERWLLANKKALDLFGFRRQVYQGHSFEEMIQLRPEFQSLLDNLHQLLRKVVENNAPLQRSLKLKYKNRQLWIDFLLLPFRCDEERRILIIGHEITSVKILQERFLAILDNLPAMVYIVHPDTGKILYHNSLFQEYFGQNFLNKSPCYQLLFGYKKHCGFCHLKDAGTSFKKTYEIYDTKRQRWLRIYESYISWLDEHIVRLGMIQDITEEKRQEENLIRSQRLEILGKVSGNITHEFNNLLSIVSGYADIITQYSVDNPRIQNYALRIQKAVESGTKLVKQLLSLSRGDSAEQGIADLNAILEEQAEILQRLVGEKILVQLDLCRKKLPVELSFEGLQHILANLVVNARDAMPEGGTITIRTRLLEQKRGEKDWIFLEVSDTGVGISPERLAQIFDPFYTTKAPGEGAGLGLTIILTLVRKVGGEVSVKSRPGEGTTFVIKLPCSKAEAGAKGKNSGTLDSKGREVSSKKILIVEDEPHIREMLAEMLEAQNFQVEMAENGREALEWLRKKHYAVDLVITDVVMPKMDGVQLYRVLQKEAPQIKILFISGYAQHVLEKYGFEEGHFRILKKPFTFKQLLAEIDEVLK